MPPELDDFERCTQISTTDRRHVARPRREPVVLVHDYLTQRGGAERVVLSLLRAYPDAPLYTSIYEPSATFPEFADHDIRPMPVLQRIGALRRDHRLGLPVYAPAFRSLTVDADLAICSSSAWAHATRVRGGRKVIYCHNPARWLWQPDDYLAELPAPVRLGARAVGPLVRRWDRRAAQAADLYLCNSAVVADRVKANYGIDAAVVFPPQTADPAAPERPLDDVAPGFLLTVARLHPYKHIDVALQAIAERPADRLVVIGDGPDRQRLVNMCPPNARIVSGADDPVLRWAYRNSRALLALSHEDFGLTPLEAAAFGRPTLARGAGGYLHTVVDDETGYHLSHVSVDEVLRGLDRLDAREWDADALRLHAQRFSERRFVEELQRHLHPEDGPRRHGTEQQATGCP